MGSAFHSFGARREKSLGRVERWPGVFSGRERERERERQRGREAETEREGGGVENSVAVSLSVVATVASLLLFNETLRTRGIHFGAGSEVAKKNLATSSYFWAGLYCSYFRC